jgi:sulfite reductase (NADPH) hemoprotein beta-component
MMSAPKRPSLPAILLANDLLDGEVVFWTGRAWSPLPREAFVAHDEDAAGDLEQAAKAGQNAQKVVDANLVDVTVDEAGVATPRHYREKIKTQGPTTRRDLGKQAGLYNIAPAGN